MVQTKQGAEANPWVVYMKACAANYKAGKPQNHSVAGKQDDEFVANPARKRLVGKQTPAAVASPQGKAKPKAKAKPIGTKEVRQLEKVAKETGKARAAKVAREKETTKS
jgi:hypothetical protein